jgi:hypothetical protein
LIKAGAIDDSPELRTKKSGDERESQKRLSSHDDPEGHKLVQTQES